MVPHQTRAVYFPILYLPQAVLMGLLGRVMDTPAALIYYLLRFSYLVIYTVMVFFAIRMVPYGKWTLTILALMPMAMIQASSLNHDAINISASFLFIAWMLHLASKENIINKWDFVFTIGLVWLVCALKLNAIILLLLLFLLPPRVLGNRRKWFAFLTLTLLAILVIYLGWNLLVTAGLEGNTPYSGVSATEQFKTILAHPIEFIRVLGSTLFDQITRYIEEWVGVTGYAYWKMPALLYWLYPLLIVFAMLAEGAEGYLNSRKRLTLAGVFGLYALSVLVIFYLTYNPVGTKFIDGVQGRYFIPAAPLLFLALLPKKALLKNAGKWIPAFIIILSLFFMVVIYLVYHVECGSSYFSRGLCYRPYYKNWSTEQSLSLPVRGASFIQQGFVPECDNLSQIRVWMNDSPASEHEGIIFTVQDNVSGEIISEQPFTGQQLSGGRWLVMELTPITDSAGKDYELILAPADLSSAQQASLAYSPTDEYPAGTLKADDQELPGDLLFQYGCLVGLEKWLRK